MAFHLSFSCIFAFPRPAWNPIQLFFLINISILRTWVWTSLQFSSVQSFSHVWLFATPWIATRQASLSITNFRSSPKLMSIKLVMPSSHLILCRPLLLLLPIPPNIRIFSNESTLHMRWPKYWSFSFSISLKKCKSKLQWDITSHQSEWPSLKSLQTINAGEGVKKRERSYTVGGNVNWYSHYGRW